MSKKFITLGTLTILTIIVTLGLWQLAGNGADRGDRIRVVASFYPLAYLAQEIGGDAVDVKSLVPYNSEVHSWQPSISDVLAAEEADIIVYNGAGLDLWFEEDMLPSLETSGKLIIETTEGIELIESQEGDGHAHDQEDGQSHDEEHEHAQDLHDPHTWLSPYIAGKQAEKIFQALVETDPENEDLYRDRWTELKERLEGIDTDFITQLSQKGKDDIFVTHSAFGYLAERYGFHQHGVIGLSADEQPSISTIEELVMQMEEKGIFTIYVDPIYSDDYAQTLKGTLEKRTGEEVQILKLYFMLGPIDGKDYIQQQQTNLINLKIGLDATGDSDGR